ncbi:hypothetical protein KEM60_02145 [Austwickia sp. TVS 96-490-7B]|nr:hypothetical protein [Austwickia sp. TVS 96-490-7B]
MVKSRSHRFWVPSGGFPGWGTQQTNPAEQVVRELHDQQPDPILIEALQRHVRQASLLGDPDSVFVSVPAPVT